MRTPSVSITCAVPEASFTVDLPLIHDAPAPPFDAASPLYDPPEAPTPQNPAASVLVNTPIRVTA